VSTAGNRTLSFVRIYLGAVDQKVQAIHDVCSAWRYVVYKNCCRKVSTIAMVSHSLLPTPHGLDTISYTPAPPSFLTLTPSNPSISTHNTKPQTTNPQDAQHVQSDSEDYSDNTHRRTHTLAQAPTAAPARYRRYKTSSMAKDTPPQSSAPSTHPRTPDPAYNPRYSPRLPCSAETKTAWSP